MKKIILLLMTALTCCGSLSAQEAHWAFNNVNDYMFNQPLVAFVQINGEYVTSADYEVGAFVGDDLRGAAEMATYSEDSHPIVEMPLYYNNGESSQVTFKLYNKATEEEVAECEASMGVALGTAHVELYFNEADAIILNFIIPATTYTVALKEGTEDATNWTIEPTEATAGTQVKATYGGTKKVKSVKAVKKAAAAPAGPVTYTELKGGEVLHVGDIIIVPSGEEWFINDTYYFSASFSSNYTIVRADVMDWSVTEKEDGQYYVFKKSNGYTFNIDENLLPVTATSDGILVTDKGISGDNKCYIFSVHEP